MLRKDYRFLRSDILQIGKKCTHTPNTPTISITTVPDSYETIMRLLGLRRRIWFHNTSNNLQASTLLLPQAVILLQKFNRYSITVRIAKESFAPNSWPPCSLELYFGWVLIFAWGGIFFGGILILTLRGVRKKHAVQNGLGIPTQYLLECQQHVTGNVNRLVRPSDFPVHTAVGRQLHNEPNRVFKHNEPYRVFNLFWIC